MVVVMHTITINYNELYVIMEWIHEILMHIHSICVCPETADFTEDTRRC